MPEVPGCLPVARRVQVPTMRERPRLCPDHREAMAVHRLSSPGITDIRDGSSQYKDVAYGLVLGGVLNDDR